MSTDEWYRAQRDANDGDNRGHTDCDGTADGRKEKEDGREALDERDRISFEMNMKARGWGVRGRWWRWSASNGRVGGRKIERVA